MLTSSRPRMYQGKNMDKVRIVCLGGLDEFYKSCTVVEINNDIFVIECGLKFPDITKPGIDYVIPRTDYLVENKDRIKAYFLTFGHDSVIGGLPYVIKKAPAPVYCSDITKAFLEMFARHNRLDISNIDIKVVDTNADLNIAGHNIHLFSTCSNIANSFGLCLESDQGNIVYIGNNVFDNNKDIGFGLNLRRIAEITAKQQTLVMLQDSIYADRAGYTNPNYRIMPGFSKMVKDAQGRVLLALEAFDVYNIIASLKEAVRLGRKIIVFDESSQDIIDVLINTKCLDLGPKAFLAMGEVNRARASEVLIILISFGPKLFHKLSLIGAHLNDDQIFRLGVNDTVIIGSHAENSAEIAETNALNELYKSGAKINAISAKTFIKMHSSEEDLKTAISVFNPRYYIPIIGTLVKLFANAKVALNMKNNLNHNSVFVLDNGMVVEFENYMAKILPNKLLVGNIYVDGKGVGDIDAKSLVERQQFSDDGVIILAATISKSKREIVLGPDIQTRGLIFVKENDALIREIEKIFLLNIRQELSKTNYSLSYMELAIKEQVFKAIRRAILKSPSIIPIIVEID